MTLWDAAVQQQSHWSVTLNRKQIQLIATDLLGSDWPRSTLVNYNYKLLTTDIIIKTTTDNRQAMPLKQQQIAFQTYLLFLAINNNIHHNKNKFITKKASVSIFSNQLNIIEPCKTDFSELILPWCWLLHSSQRIKTPNNSTSQTQSDTELPWLPSCGNYCDNESVQRIREYVIPKFAQFCGDRQVSSNDGQQPWCVISHRFIFVFQQLHQQLNAFGFNKLQMYKTAAISNVIICNKTTSYPFIYVSANKVNLDCTN